jgi:hypothetical protein
MVELRVTTWVAARDQIAAPSPGERLQTQIDLVQGDIRNEIGDRFVTDEAYRDLRQFHLEQVAVGQRIIQQNLQSLQQLFTVLSQRHGAPPPVEKPPLPPNTVASAATSDPSPAFEEPAWEANAEEGLALPVIEDAPASPQLDWAWDPEELPELPLAGWEELALQSPTPAEADATFEQLDWVEPPPPPDDPQPEPPSADLQFPDGGWPEPRHRRMPHRDLPRAALREPAATATPEEDEDWDEFVEFVEEPPTGEAGTSGFNPFAWPPEQLSNTSIIEEDWQDYPSEDIDPAATVRRVMDDPQAPPPTDDPAWQVRRDRRTDWGKDTLGEAFYHPPEEEET